MSELKFEAEIVGLCSDRYPPTGWEDKFIRTYEKDKVSVKKSARVAMEKDFRPVDNGEMKSAVTKEGNTERGTKSLPLYRFARVGGATDASKDVDTSMLAFLVRKCQWGAVNQAAGFFGDGNTGGMSQREKQGLGIQLSVKEFEFSKHPTYDIYKLIGGHGSGQCWVESMERVSVEGRIFSYASADVTMKPAKAIETLRFGPFRMATWKYTTLEEV